MELAAKAINGNFVAQEVSRRNQRMVRESPKQGQGDISASQVSNRHQYGQAHDDRSREQLLEEGKSISEMVEFASVIPERANLPYFIISMPWYTRW